MFNKKQRVGIISFLIIFMTTSIQANAAVTSKSVKKVMAGWSVALDKPTNVTIDKKKVTGYNNKTNKPYTGFKYKKSFTAQTQTGGSLSSEISSNISLEAKSGPGKANGGLASKIQAATNYNYIQTETDEISLSFGKNDPIPAKKELIVSRYTKAKQVKGYAKKYLAWVPVKSGSVTITTPECIMFTHKIT